MGERFTNLTPKDIRAGVRSATSWVSNAAQDAVTYLHSVDGEVADRIREIESCEGFEKLNSWQQRFIKTSLTLSQKGSHAFLDRIGTVLFPKLKQRWAEVSDNTSCHIAVDALEKGESLFHPQGARTREERYEFFGTTIDPNAPMGWNFNKESIIQLQRRPKNGGTSNILLPPNIFDIESALERATYPAVIQLFRAPTLSEYNDRVEPAVIAYHSCVAFKDKRTGEIKIWEKPNNEIPFRVQSLRELYQRYQYVPPGKDQPFLWRARPLRKEIFKIAPLRSAR